MRQDRLIYMVIRMAKKDAAFIYFILESCEGLFFYSTMDHSLKERYRDIDIKGSISLLNEIDHVIEYLKKQSLIEVLSRTIIENLVTLDNSPK